MQWVSMLQVTCWLTDGRDCPTAQFTVRLVDFMLKNCRQLWTD